jgi:hypothetical protein
MEAVLIDVTDSEFAPQQTASSRGLSFVKCKYFLNCIHCIF